MGELKKDLRVTTRDGEVNINLTITFRIEGGGLVAAVEAAQEAPPPPRPRPPIEKVLAMDEDGPVVPDLGDDGELITFGKED